MYNTRLEKKVSEFLGGYKCPVAIKGYGLLLGCLLQVYLHPWSLESIYKDVYQEIAMKSGVDEKNVERSIRVLINNWWADLEKFGLFKCKPSNKQLLTILYEEFVKQELARDSDYESVLDLVFG